MKRSYDFLNTKNRIVRNSSLIVTIICLFSFYDAAAQMGGDTTLEKKVDYLERIYFSGKNTDELKTMIQSTIQELDGKPATTSVAKQYSFLTGIQSKALSNDASCDIVEMIAVGIYGLDANEASLQKISRPSEKANKNAMETLNSINNTFSNVSSKTSQAALTNWYLSGGTASFGTASKVASAANSVSTITSTVGSVGDIKKTLKTLGIGTGKAPCKKAGKKDIEIGPHVVPPSPTEISGSSGSDQQAIAGGTQITIRNINDDQLSILTALIKKIPGVATVNDDEYNNNIATLVIAHNMTISELIEKIKGSSGLNFKVESRSSKNATLEVKK